MTIAISTARIEVYQGHDYEPNVDDIPDFTIPGSDIESVNISARTDEIMDDVSVSLHNSDDRYTQQYPLKQADRIEFYAPVEDPELYGGGIYGDTTWGGQYFISWTGRIVDISGDRDDTQQSHIDIKARDYPADILSNRKFTNSYVDEDVGVIIRDVLRRKAPEVDRTQIPDFGVTTDVKYTSADCWDILINLAARVDAIVVPKGQSLRVDRIGNLPYRFEVFDSDLYLPVETESDDSIKNVVRIDSGEHRKIEDAQETVNLLKRIDSATPDTHRLRARKSSIHSVELYIRKQSEDSIKIRLQSDEGGAPIDIADEDSDIASATVSANDLPEEGWIAFYFSEHTLADRDPWIIIESGDTGHDYGHNTAGDLSFRSYYPHPLNFEVSDTESISQYGMREIRIEKANLQTLTATRGAARAELARRAWPMKTVEFEARSGRTHHLRPGDRIDINRPGDDVIGEHIVTDVDREWSAGRMVLETKITAQWRKGVLAPVN